MREKQEKERFEEIRDGILCSFCRHMNWQKNKDKCGNCKSKLRPYEPLTDGWDFENRDYLIKYHADRMRIDGNKHYINGDKEYEEEKEGATLEEVINDILANCDN